MRRIAPLLLLPLLFLSPPSTGPTGSAHVDDDDDEEQEALERSLRSPGLRPEPPSEQREAQRWWLRQRVYPGTTLPIAAQRKAQKAIKAVPRARRKAPSPGSPQPPQPPAPPPAWTFVGPAPVQTTQGSLVTPNMSPSAGRASAIAVNPQNPQIVYAGFALGGVWKSTNGGDSWTPLMDDQPTLSIGSILLDPNNPEKLWVGTGEPAYYAGYAGQGIFQSTNGGQSFTLLAGAPFDGLAVSRLVLDEQTGDLYAAASFGIRGRGEVCTNTYFDAPGQGLYRSTNGGVDWTLLKAGKIVDVEVDQSVTPRVIHVSDYETGLHRSINGGSSFSQPTGLPQVAERIEVGFSPADPTIVYAAFSQGVTSTTYVSHDRGASYAEIPGAPDHCYSQCTYDNAVAVHPTDPDTIYLGGGLCPAWKGTGASTGSPSWSAVSMPNQTCEQGFANWYLGTMHPDIHWITFDPTNPEVVYYATDGGVAKSTDGGATWQRKNDGVGTLQFYAICASPTDATRIVGGTQDNGSMVKTSQSLTWRGLVSGDGGPCAFDAGDAKTILISNFEGSVFRTGNGFGSNGLATVFNADPSSCVPNVDKGCGDRSGFISPLIGDPVTPGVFYVGTYRLWKNDNQGKASGWKPVSDDLTAGQASVPCPDAASFPQFDDVLNAIAVAPSAPSTIYTGSQAGVLQVTTDGGGTWTRIDKAPLPNRWVSGIAVDPADSKVVYVAYSGFDEHTPGATGHVFRSTDGGATWEKRDIGVNIPANSIAAHPVGRDLVYVGTDVGVLVTTDGGKTWSALDDGLPNTAVYSLVFHRPAMALAAGTHGRSAWKLPFGPAGLGVDPPAITVTVERGKTPGPVSAGVINTDDLGSIINFTAQKDQPWLTLGAEQGSAAGAVPTPIPLIIDVTGKGIGEYDASVTVTPEGGGAPITVPVHLTITAPLPPPVRVEAGGGGLFSCSASGVGGERGLGALAAFALLGLAVARRRRRAFLSR